MKNIIRAHWLPATISWTLISRSAMIIHAYQVC
jgi:hypothetical protein